VFSDKREALDARDKLANHSLAIMASLWRSR